MSLPSINKVSFLVNPDYDKFRNRRVQKDGSRQQKNLPPAKQSHGLVANENYTAYTPAGHTYKVAHDNSTPHRGSLPNTSERQGRDPARKTGSAPEGKPAAGRPQHRPKVNNLVDGPLEQDKSHQTKPSIPQDRQKQKYAGVPTKELKNKPEPKFASNWASARVDHITRSDKPDKKRNESPARDLSKTPRTEAGSTIPSEHSADHSEASPVAKIPKTSVPNASDTTGSEKQEQSQVDETDKANNKPRHTNKTRFVVKYKDTDNHKPEQPERIQQLYVSTNDKTKGSQKNKTNTSPTRSRSRSQSPDGRAKYTLNEAAGLYKKERNKNKVIKDVNKAKTHKKGQEVYTDPMAKLPPWHRNEYVLTKREASMYRHIHVTYNNERLRKKRQVKFYKKLEQIQLDEWKRKHQEYNKKQQEKLEAREKQQEQLEKLRGKYQGDQILRFQSQYVTRRILQTEKANRHEFGLPEDVGDRPQQPIMLLTRDVPPREHFDARKQKEKNQLRYKRLFAMYIAPKYESNRRPKMEGIDTVELGDSDDDDDGNSTGKKKSKPKSRNVREILQEAVDAMDDDTDAELSDMDDDGDNKSSPVNPAGPKKAGATKRHASEPYQPPYKRATKGHSYKGSPAPHLKRNNMPDNNAKGQQGQPKSMAKTAAGYGGKKPKTTPAKLKVGDTNKTTSPTGKNYKGTVDYSRPLVTPVQDDDKDGKNKTSNKGKYKPSKAGDTTKKSNNGKIDDGKSDVETKDKKSNQNSPDNDETSKNKKPIDKTDSDKNKTKDKQEANNNNGEGANPAGKNNDKSASDNDASHKPSVRFDPVTIRSDKAKQSLDTPRDKPHIHRKKDNKNDNKDMDSSGKMDKQDSDKDKSPDSSKAPNLGTSLGSDSQPHPAENASGKDTTSDPSKQDEGKGEDKLGDGSGSEKQPSTGSSFNKDDGGDASPDSNGLDSNSKIKDGDAGDNVQSSSTPDKLEGNENDGLLNNSGDTSPKPDTTGDESKDTGANGDTGLQSNDKSANAEDGQGKLSSEGASSKEATQLSLKKSPSTVTKEPTKISLKSKERTNLDTDPDSDKNKVPESSLSGADKAESKTGQDLKVTKEPSVVSGKENGDTEPTGGDNVEGDGSKGNLKGKEKSSVSKSKSSSKDDLKRTATDENLKDQKKEPSKESLKSKSSSKAGKDKLTKQKSNVSKGKENGKSTDTVAARKISMEGKYKLKITETEKESVGQKKQPDSDSKANKNDKPKKKKVPTATLR